MEERRIAGDVLRRQMARENNEQDVYVDVWSTNHEQGPDGVVKEDNCCDDKHREAD